MTKIWQVEFREKEITDIIYTRENFAGNKIEDALKRAKDENPDFRVTKIELIAEAED